MNKLVNFLIISQPFVTAGRLSILQEESCSKMDRNTIDAAMDFYGDESSARMLTVGALVFLFQIVV